MRRFSTGIEADESYGIQSPRSHTLRMNQHLRIQTSEQLPEIMASVRMSAAVRWIREGVNPHCFGR
jgi:hypothetical protein